MTPENDAALVGTTVGTTDQPLAAYIQSLSAVYTGAGSPSAYDRDNNVGNDTFSIDGGPAQTFDVAVRYSGTLTYMDGTTATDNFFILQDTSGRTYLVPASTQDTSQDALEAKPIQSFTFGDPGTFDFNLTASRDFANFSDGTIVQGTVNSDNMYNGYVDADGDQINNFANTIYADAGDDHVDAGGGNDTVYGGDGADDIYGGDGDDTLFGDAGNDYIIGNGGTDTIYGGAGNDLIDDEPGAPNGTSTDVFYGGDGDDNIYLGGGADTGYGGNDVDVIVGEEGNDLIYGDGGSDFLYGSQGDDTLYGGSGWDSLGGGDDNDTLYGGSGGDSLGGDNGNDVLFGGGDTDSLYGGAGNDTLSGDTAGDMLYGGTGTDTLDYATNFTATTVNLSTNTASGGDADGDLIGEFENIRGSAFDDWLTLSNTAGTIWAGAGDDTLIGGGSSDRLDGGAGTDTVDYSANFAATTVNLLTGSGSGGMANGDVLVDIENIVGSAYSDTLILSNSDSTIWAGAGNDALTGGTGKDVLDGEAGNDTLYGGAGDDQLIINLGNDLAYGGFGSDTFKVSDTTTSSIIVGGEDPGNTDTDILQLYAFGGSTSATVVFTGNEAGTFSFSGGSNGTFSEIEWVDASEVGDYVDASVTTSGITVSGYYGDDTIIGGSGNDDLLGDEGNDSLYGGAGADFIDGGVGDDVLRGGAGDDLLSGGAGNDTFVMDQAGGADVVTDFDLGDADADGFYNDQLDVSVLRTPGGAPVTAFDVIVVDDGFGNAKLIFPEGETVVLQGVSPAQMATAGQRYSAGIPCFTPGTMIRTPCGARPVEALRPGDLVLTRDNGPQRLVWVGMRRLDAAELDAAPHLRPIRIAPGAFGNDRPLLVSPQHGMLLAGPEGQGTRLVRAKHLAQMQGGQARVMKGARRVTYVHLMFEAHQIVISNGLPSESFYPGPQALAMLHLPEVCELLTLFPDLRLGALAAVGPVARPILRRSALPSHLNEMRAAPH